MTVPVAVLFGVTFGIGFRRGDQMTKVRNPPPTHGRWSAVRTGFVLLLAAWLVLAIALVRGLRISAQIVGPGEDVTDALRRAGYVAERLLPFDIVVLILDVAAVVVLSRANRLSLWCAAVWVLWIPSVVLHGLVFLVHLIVAG